MHKKLIDIRKTFRTITNQEIDDEELNQALLTNTDVMDDNERLLTTIHPHIDIFESILNELQGYPTTLKSNIMEAEIEFFVFRNVRYLKQSEFNNLLRWRKCIEPNELCNLLYTIFVEEELLMLCKKTEVDFVHFLNILSYSYNRNTYHNIYHALDVAVRGYYLYKKIERNYVKSKITLLSLLLGCLLHDVGHLGLRSSFLNKKSAFLEQRFGCISLNEKMHFHIAKIILKSEKHSIISNLTHIEQIVIFDNIEKMILSTDLTMHTQYKDMLAEYKSRKSNIIIKGPTEKMSLIELITIIKTADISNSTTEFNYYNKISNLVIAEENEERCLENEFPWALDSDESYNFKLKFIEIYALDYFMAVKKRFFEFGFLYDLALKNGKLLRNKVDVGIDDSFVKETGNNGD